MVEGIVEELQGNRGALPLLQFTSAKLWEERDTTGKVLEAKSLAQLGGVAGTLARHADQVLDSMSPQEVETAREVLIRLVTPERTRAVVSLPQLRELFTGREAALTPTLTKLVDSRLVVTEGKGQGSQGARERDSAPASARGPARP